MSYVIYEQSSTLIMGTASGERVWRPDHRKTYKTMAAARAALTRASNQWWNLLGRFGDEPEENDPVYRYAIAEKDHFHKRIEKQVKRKVLEGFGGKEYYEPINTPNYMSPSSETYWSM